MTAKSNESKQGQITRSISELFRKADELEKLVGELSTLLAPILNDEEPKDDSGEENCAKQKVVLAEAIDRATTRFETTAERIRSFISRIEL
jgi:hypothetical protein